MGTIMLKLPRKLLGYDREAVERLLADRDALMRIADQRLQEAEGRVQELEAEIVKRDDEITAIREQVEAMAQEVMSAVEPRDPAPVQERGTGSLTLEFMRDEMAKVVQAAEESSTRIIERAWESTQSQISEVDRLWREVQDEIVRFAAWRQDIDPLISGVRDGIREAQERIAVVPERIVEAIRPALEAMGDVDRRIGRFSAASGLPSLIGSLGLDAPQGQDPAEAPEAPSESAEGTVEEPSAAVSPESGQALDQSATERPVIHVEAREEAVVSADGW